MASKQQASSDGKKQYDDLDENKAWNMIPVSSHRQFDVTEKFHAKNTCKAWLEQSATISHYDATHSTIPETDSEEAHLLKQQILSAVSLSHPHRRLSCTG